jgi:hypothetical protein
MTLFPHFRGLRGVLFPPFRGLRGVLFPPFRGLKGVLFPPFISRAFSFSGVKKKRKVIFC